MLLDMSPSCRLSSPCNRSAQPVDTERVEAALLKVATLVVEDPAFVPVFERLEADLAAAVKEKQCLSQAQRRARALLAQEAMRAMSSATCSSDAPMPYRSRSSR